MKKKIIVLATSLFAVIALAQTPVVNISKRHGNLREAQELIVQAFERVSDAQAINNYNLGGHAGKAKEFLRRADEELKLAANDLR